MWQKHAPFFVLLSAYLVLAGLYAWVTPDWQAPDEPAHVNYVRQLADGQWPVMAAGDYDQAYQSMVIGSEFDPAFSVLPFSYEDYQPPLYYLLLTPVYWLSSGWLFALRLVSVMLGAGVVALTYGIGRLSFPTRPWLALTATAVVAFLPQHLAILGSVNNDALAWLLVAGGLFVLTRLTVRDSAESLPRRDGLTLALLLGLAFLTKVTAYLLAPVVAVWLLWRFWGRWPQLLTTSAWLFGAALALGSLWWGRNVLLYPGPDVLGTLAHDAVVTGQPTTAEWVSQFGLVEVLRRFAVTTFRSFWGQVGWMAAPLPGWAYRPILLATLAAAVGLLVRVRPSRQHRPLLLIFGTLLTLNSALYIAYNLTYVQHQARYLFASLIPLALALALGWEVWLTPLARRRPWLGYLLPLGVFLGLVGLNGYVLRFILPCLDYANAAC
jgi:4-amino-4-deoxy-L-arabinose transferase-like glycosyltransferase